MFNQLDKLIDEYINNKNTRLTKSEWLNYKYINEIIAANIKNNELTWINEKYEFYCNKISLKNLVHINIVLNNIFNLFSGCISYQHHNDTESYILEKYRNVRINLMYFRYFLQQFMIKDIIDLITKTTIDCW